MANVHFRVDRADLASRLGRIQHSLDAKSWIQSRWLAIILLGAVAIDGLSGASNAEE